MRTGLPKQEGHTDAQLSQRGVLVRFRESGSSRLAPTRLFTSITTYENALRIMRRIPLPPRRPGLADRATHSVPPCEERRGVRVA